MLRERVLSGLALGIPVLVMLLAGGPWMAVLVFAVGSIAMIEFTHLVARRGHRAFGGLLILWMALFTADRVFPGLKMLSPGIAVMLLVTLAWSLIRFRQGTANAVTGFAMTLAAAFYIGWPAAHMISLRALDNGLFWTLTVIFTVWSADTGAYLLGQAIGHTPFVRDISPGKTWEGYVAGIVTGTGMATLMQLLWQALGATAAVTPLRGMIIGLLVSSISPLGDLGISMLKRYARAKNSSNLIPGHGGFLDRIDSLIVAGLIGYYYLVLFVL
jgi:phosphatidate cytidylyltransferase